MIRDMADEDVAQLERIHEDSGFDYKFPDLSDALFVVKKVFDDQGVKQGIALKIEATVYLWVDPKYGKPQDRWARLQELVTEAKLEGWKKGLDTLTCVVPPALAKQFAKRLGKIGMTRDRAWPKFSFDLTKYVPVQSGSASR